MSIEDATRPMREGLGQAVSEEGANGPMRGVSGLNSERRRSERADARRFGAQAVSDEGANVAPRRKWRSRPVSRILCPGPRSRRRPSLSARRRVSPPRRRVAVHPRRAAYPAARAGRPRTLPAWPCSGWGLPSRRGHPRRWCALTAPFHPYLSEERRSAFCCAYARSPPPGSPQHPALRSPDFPRPRDARPRPPGRLLRTQRTPSAPPPATGRRRGSRGRRPRCSARAARART